MRTPLKNGTSAVETGSTPRISVWIRVSVTELPRFPVVQLHLVMASYLNHPSLVALLDKYKFNRNDQGFSTKKKVRDIAKAAAELLQEEVHSSDYDNVEATTGASFTNSRLPWVWAKLTQTETMQDFWLPETEHLNLEALHNLANRPLSCPITKAGDPLALISDYCSADRSADDGRIPKHRGCIDSARRNHRYVEASRILPSVALRNRLVRFRRRP